MIKKIFKLFGIEIFYRKEVEQLIKTASSATTKGWVDYLKSDHVYVSKIGANQKEEGYELVSDGQCVLTEFVFKRLTESGIEMLPKELK